MLAMKNTLNTITDVSSVTTESKSLNNQKDYEMTQDEVAKAIGVTRVAIQQIETRALIKLKKELRRRNLAALELLI